MPNGAAAGFRLMRYFALSTAMAFIAVGATLYFLQRGEEAFFDQVQQQQAAYFRQTQEELARQHEDAALATMLAVHEANHVTLTRVVANLMWDTDIAPFLAATQRVPIADCVSLPAEPLAARRRCWGDVGRRIAALPAFKALDAKAYKAMRQTTVFKMKVFDLRGITVYSSEHGQIGEYAGENRGWRTAIEGRPATELTHRDRFSAFERVVENRDLISTYVPIRSGSGDTLLGVVELYSDATPFLDQIRSTSRKFAQITAGHRARVADAARGNQAKVQGNFERSAAQQIRTQGDRIADFATARSESRELVDVNAMLKAGCDFLAFDRRFRQTPLEFRPGERLPACELVPDLVNEVVMNLLQACVEDEPPRFRRVVVESRAEGDRVVVRRHP